MKKYLNTLSQCYSWVKKNGINSDHKLGIVDEILAMFVGITLFVSYTEWLANYPKIILSILITVSLTVITIVLIINTRSFPKRIILCFVALFIAYIGIQWILKVSRNDLHPEIIKLYSIILGIVIWMFIREASTFLLNIFYGKSKLQ